MRVGGIVLCGGKSSRMGRPKASLPFGPELLLQRVVRLLHEAVAPIVVVGAQLQELPELPPDVLTVRDEAPHRGPLEGLRAGLAALQGRVEAAYATACDVPLLVPDFVRQLVELLGQHEIVVPADGQFRHPLAAVYRLSVLPTVEGLLQADRLRPAYLYDCRDTLQVPVERLRASDPQLATLANVNRPEDYLAALQLCGFKPPADFCPPASPQPDDP